jgi:hypothetical protein
MSDETVGNLYSSLLLDQLSDERAKKASLEQRGIYVITTSGALVTLTLGFAALATRAQTYRLPYAAVVILIAALAGFVSASAMGLLVNAPWKTEVVGQGLEEITEAEWGTKGDWAAREIYGTRNLLLDGARRTNALRGRLLLLALILEVTSLGLMASSVGVILYSLL